MTLYFGIDPGVSGAIAVLNPEGKLAAVEDLPIVEVKVGKTKRRRLVARELADRLLELCDGKVLDAQVIIEEVGVFPGDGKVAAFRFGHAAGLIEGIVCSLGFAYRFAKPNVWKRAMGIPKDKKEARVAVVQRFPEAAPFLRRVRDHNRAEAIALADYLRRLDTTQEMN